MGEARIEQQGRATIAQEQEDRREQALCGALDGHASGWTVIVNDQGKVQQSLHDYIKAHPGIMASEKISSFVKQFDDLPFVFKVVSVNQAQPFKSHPYKSKMAITMTNFELLCGVRDPKEIKSNVEPHPELVRLIGGHEALKKLADRSRMAQAQQQARLKDVIQQFWTIPKQEVQKVIDSVAGRLSKKENRTPIDDLVLRLNNNSPGNLGVLAPYFHHHVTLKPGQAIYIEPNQPRIYLTGDCIECKRVSTKLNKFRCCCLIMIPPNSVRWADLNYKTSVPRVLEPRENPDGTVQYSLPIDGLFGPKVFAVQKIMKNATELNRKTSVSILIVVQGEAKIGETMARTGDVFFLPLKFHAKVVPTDNNNIEKNEFIAFRAYVPPQSYFVSCSGALSGRRAPEHDTDANWDAE